MQNLNNSPARWDENDKYIRDPSDPKAKPYSTNQVAANQEHKNRVTLYHKTHGRRVFNKVDDDIQALEKEGWRDTPFVHPRHPDEKVELESVNLSENQQAERDALYAEAAKLGIDGRRYKQWSMDKLRKEVLKAAKAADSQ